MSSNDLSAMILAGAISTSPLEPTPRHERSQAPRYAQVPRRREPLDLTAAVFRYLKTMRGEIQPLREIAVHLCRCSGCARR